MRLSISLYSLLFLPFVAGAQSGAFFYSHGNNLSELNCSGVLFAPLTNEYHQAFGAGAALVRKPINLLQDFSVSFLLDFIDTTGVDGGAFIFQSDPLQEGDTYNGLGVKGINHSLAITFDAKQNAGHNDPVFDHVSFQANGDVDHNTPNNLAGPVSFEHLYRQTVYPPGDKEKQFLHPVTIHWKAGAKELAVLVEGVVLLNATVDLVGAVFNGNPTVYWGFAASNTQPVWYPASKELQFGYLRFSFGDVFPRLKTIPETDTCFGPPVQVIDSSVYGEYRGVSGLSGARWFWDFGDGQTATVRNPPAHVYAAAGDYQVRFAVTNAFGCTFDTLVRTIALGAKPVADFTFSATCVGTPINFVDQSTVAGGGIFHWDWQFGNSSTSGEQEPSFVFPGSGRQAVSLKVRSNLGCESDTVKILSVDERPVVRFSYNEDCAGTVSFTASPQNGVPVKTWQWAFGDGQSSVLQNPVHHFLANGNYAVELASVSNGGCASDAVHETILVDVPTAFAGNDTTAINGEPLQLSGRGNGAFLWSPATGLDHPEAASPVAVLSADQSYVLTVTTSRGCVARDTVHIRLFAKPDLFVASAFTPNQDGRNDVLHLAAPGFRQLLYFRIYNRWGQLLFETRNSGTGWDGTYQRQDLPAGVYVWVAAGLTATNRRVEKKGTVMLIR